MKIDQSSCEDSGNSIGSKKPSDLEYVNDVVVLSEDSNKLRVFCSSER